MHERSRTTPRRRGPKHPLPAVRHMTHSQNVGAQEPPYYTIDNTEDIYGTNILPSQRCYIDPWDLENYDYVRSKLHETTTTDGGFYETTATRKSGAELSQHYLPSEEAEFDAYTPRMAATMPRRTSRRQSQYQCDMKCCSAQVPKPSNYAVQQPNAGDKYNDYMTYMSHQLTGISDEDDPAADYLLQQNLYNGYGANSSNSSNERHSSIDEELQYNFQPAASTLRRQTRTPKIEFPAPPKQPPPPPATVSTPSYDYCQPYSTLPPTYCSMPECYECLTHARQHANETALIYAAPSTYNTTASTPMSLYGTYDTHAGYAGATSTLGRPRVSTLSTKSASLYAGIYANKFGLSKKGLLQIDYSCSWNDLDRIIARNY